MGMKLCVTESDFLEKIFSPSKLGKWAKNRVFWIYWKIWHYFLPNLLYNEYLFAVFLHKSHITGNFFSLRYSPKCSQPIRSQDFLINHISRTKQWNSLIFCMLIQLHINQKLIKEFLSRDGQKWVWPVWSWDSKINCISRTDRWNELIFCMLVLFHES